MKTVLIDLSAIFRRFWHASESEELNFARRKTLEMVRGCYHNFDDVKICVDCPPYRRKEIYPEYKANRPEPPPLVMGELEKCKRAILEDGWSVLTCHGAEADDIIATYCIQSHPDDGEIEIYGADKDLLQLQLSNVSLFDPFGKKTITAQDKLGVEPSQVVDCLSLMGDKSDNIPGVNGIGPKIAANLLKDFGTIDGILLAIGETPEKFRDSIKEKITDSRETLMMARKLITLDANCEIVEEKLDPKEIEKDTEGFSTDDADFEDGNTETVHNESPDEGPESTEIIQHEAPRTHIIKHEEVTYSRALEPVDTEGAWRMANTLFNSGMFDKFRNEKQAFAVMIRGRSLGIDAVTSLEEMNVIKGKTQMSAILMMGLCMRSPVCEYFELIESTDKIATFATKRKGNRKETVMSYTEQDAMDMGLIAKGGPWKTQKPNMIRWRCASTISRIVYPDIVAGVYTPDEIENFDNAS